MSQFVFASTLSEALLPCRCVSGLMPHKRPPVWPSTQPPRNCQPGLSQKAILEDESSFALVGCSVGLAICNCVQYKNYPSSGHGEHRRPRSRRDRRPGPRDVLGVMVAFRRGPTVYRPVLDSAAAVVCSADDLRRRIRSPHRGDGQISHRGPRQPRGPRLVGLSPHWSPKEIWQGSALKENRSQKGGKTQYGPPTECAMCRTMARQLDLPTLEFGLERVISTTTERARQCDPDVCNRGESVTELSRRERGHRF